MVYVFPQLCNHVQEVALFFSHFHAFQDPRSLKFHLNMHMDTFVFFLSDVFQLILYSDQISFPFLRSDHGRLLLMRVLCENKVISVNDGVGVVRCCQSDLPSASVVNRVKSLEANLGEDKVQSWGVQTVSGHQINAIGGTTDLIIKCTRPDLSVLCEF